MRWLLAGSAERALVGCPVRPRDIDIEVAPGDADRAAAALGARIAGGGGGGRRRSRRAAARRAGIEVDLTGDLVVEGPGGLLPADFALQWQWSHPAAACGRAIRVAPLEESLCRANVLGDWDALAKVAGQAGAAASPVRLSSRYVTERLSSATASATR